METALRIAGVPDDEFTPVRSLIALFSLLATQTDSARASDPILKPAQSMNTYVILFRQGSRPLTADEIQRRAQETSAWARSVSAAGLALDPRILDAESRLLPPAGETVAPPTGPAVIALLFLQAADLDEATRAAETHPGRRYGTTIEVRPWAAPVRLAQAEPNTVPAR